LPPTSRNDHVSRKNVEAKEVGAPRPSDPELNVGKRPNVPVKIKSEVVNAAEKNPSKLQVNVSRTSKCIAREIIAKDSNIATLTLSDAAPTNVAKSVASTLHSPKLEPAPIDAISETLQVHSPQLIEVLPAGEADKVGVNESYNATIKIDRNSAVKLPKKSIAKRVPSGKPTKVVPTSPVLSSTPTLLPKILIPLSPKECSIAFPPGLSPGIVDDMDEEAMDSPPKSPPPGRSKSRALFFNPETMVSPDDQHPNSLLESSVAMESLPFSPSHSNLNVNCTTSDDKLSSQTDTFINALEMEETIQDLEVVLIDVVSCEKSETGTSSLEKETCQCKLSPTEVVDIGNLNSSFVNRPVKSLRKLLSLEKLLDSRNTSARKPNATLSGRNGKVENPKSNRAKRSKTALIRPPLPLEKTLQGRILGSKETNRTADGNPVVKEGRFIGVKTSMPCVETTRYDSNISRTESRILNNAVKLLGEKSIPLNLVKL
jgi:hypothetical protein